jgi:hypothetical protein
MRRTKKRFLLQAVAAAVTIGVFLLCGCTAPQRESAAADGVRHRARQAFSDAPAETAAAGDFVGQPPLFSDPVGARAAAVTTRGGTLPDWVRDASDEFPPGRYLTALGRGADRLEAEDRARADIARFFHTEIESNRQTRESIRQRSAAQGVQTDHRIRSVEQLRISSRKMLSGVWIARVHQNTASPEREFYVLAALDRRQAAAAAAANIRSLDAAIQKSLAALEGQDRWNRIRMLQTCLEHHDRRSLYAAELRVLQPEAGGIDPVVSRDDLENRLARLLREDLLVAVAVTGAGSERVGRSLVAALTQKGFSVTERVSQARLIARGAVDIEADTAIESTWKFVRWRVHFDLMDARAETIFASIGRSGREGHLTVPKAEQRALRQIEAALTGEIAVRLDDFIRGKNP